LWCEEILRLSLPFSLWLPTHSKSARPPRVSGRGGGAGQGGLGQSDVDERDFQRRRKIFLYASTTTLTTSTTSTTTLTILITILVHQLLLYYINYYINTSTITLLHQLLHYYFNYLILSTTTLLHHLLSYYINLSTSTTIISDTATYATMLPNNYDRNYLIFYVVFKRTVFNLLIYKVLIRDEIIGTKKNQLFHMPLNYI